MTATDQIGQLFMVGLDSPRLTSHHKAWLKQLRPGGIILFEQNLESPKQIAALTVELQAINPDLPLVIAVDQEGGKVSRLPPPFTRFPHAATLGARGSASLTYAVGEAIGRELAVVGINLNLAPVLDTNTNPHNPVIGSRAFGASPMVVSQMGLAFLAGLQDQGVLGCGKHFPGHGDTSEDSHKTLPVVSHPITRLRDVELRPFCHAIQNRLHVIMLAHVLYPALDKTSPASLSRAIVDQLLRQTLKFQGLVMTDDLGMHAITQHHRTEAAAVQALLAGVDLVLIRREEAADRAVQGVRQAIADGTLPSSQSELAIERVRAFKARCIRVGQPTPAEVPQLVASHKRLVAELRQVHERQTVSLAD